MHTQTNLLVQIYPETQSTTLLVSEVLPKAKLQDFMTITKTCIRLPLPSKFKNLLVSRNSELTDYYNKNLSLEQRGKEMLP